MDYFTDERIRQNKEVIDHLPDTIYSMVAFNAALSKKQGREYRESLKKQQVKKGTANWKVFKKAMKVGTNSLRKCLASVHKMGMPLCEPAAGCNACCRKLVVLESAMERDAIAHYIKNMTQDEQELVREGFHRNRRIKESALLAYGLKKEPIPDIVEKQIELTYAETGGFCPLIGPTGRCLIYPVRPWLCRIFRVIGSECRAGERINVPVFPDLNVTILGLLNSYDKDNNKKTTLFPVIRTSLSQPEPPPAWVPTILGE